MISRSNSNAGKRTQGRKPGSPAKHHNSGHQRSTTSIDPFITRQQAESAAVEAYYRLSRYPSPPLEPYKPAPARIHRRKSQITGRTEGSHLEDARLGRRQSASRKAESARPKLSATSQHTRREPIPTTPVEQGERIVTHRRSVIPPNPRLLQASAGRLTASSSTRPIRSFQSVHSDGSPAQRNHLFTSHDLSSTRSHAPYTGPLADGRLSQLSDFPAFDSSHGIVHHDPFRRRASVRETQTDDEILAIARDRCLQDFHQGKLRERKSFMQIAFPRRRSALTTSSNASHKGFDRALPPFNSADDPPLPLDPEPPNAYSSPIVQIATRRGRSFTTTLKGRLMKVMGKTQSGASTIPAQQIAAHRPHHVLDDPASIAAQDADANTGYATTPAEMQCSYPGDGSVRSRVTSWTDSTVAGTTNTRVQPYQPVTVESLSVDLTDTSHPLLRKTSSFFGRSIRKKLRKPSRSELNVSEESQRLYSALQSHMQPADEGDGRVPSAQHYSLRTGSALSTLPSQCPSASEGRARRNPSTIRTVTPNLPGNPPRVPSPVTEIASPSSPAGKTSKAASPSHEQVTKRVEKTQNRWKSQLVPSRRPRDTIDQNTDNPYELPFLRGRGAVVPLPTPENAKTGATTTIMSPSIYSHATDGASRPVTPIDRLGTTVKITGREIRRYSISPRKANAEPPTVHGSAEWRRWLSGEMTAFRPAYEEIPSAGDRHQTGLSTPCSDPPTCPTLGHTKPQDSGSGNDSDGLMSRTRPTQPRPSSSRKSSLMNDRYPMLDGSRNSSNKSIESRRVSSADTKTDAKVVHNARSVAQLQPGQTSKTGKDGAKVALRPKSALELRAQYKSRRASTARPLDVRRKTTQDTKVLHGSLSIGDNTIRDISAGPYAVRTAGKDDKENSPLVSPALASLPSTEWLAAGTTKSRHAPLTLGNRNVSRYSPGKSSPGGKNSPAQRMATQFLEEREKRSREGTPAAAFM